MGKVGIKQAQGKHLCRVVEGEGMSARGDDKLRSEHGKFYVENGVTAVAHSRGVHTTQQTAGGKKGGTITGAIPRANGDPNDGIPEQQYHVTAGPGRGGSGKLHFGSWPGGLGTEILASAQIPQNKGLDVVDVKGGTTCHGTGRIHLWNRYA